MPRVLRVINRFNVGGITYNVAYLSRFLPPEYETKVVGGVPLPDEAHSGYILDQLGVPYTEIASMKRSINPLNDWRTFRQFRRIIREFRPDIVHTHAAKAGLARLAAWMEGVPVIVHTFHGHVFSGYFSGWKTWIVKVIERNLARISTAIVAISEKQKDELTRIHKIAGAEKVHVIRLGFDLRRFGENMEEKAMAFREKYHLRETNFAIGIIGRFAPVKNHRLFFDMFILLKKRYPQARAFIVGDGEMKQELMTWTANLKCSDTNEPDQDIYFVSWVKRVDEVIAGLNLIALTSLNEGTPVSIIEAQAAGKPVISTLVGGVPDVIEDGRTGVIVHDFSPESFADAIGKLIENPELYTAMGEAAKSFTHSNYNYERLVCEIDVLYRQLLLQKTPTLYR